MRIKTFIEKILLFYKSAVQKNLYKSLPPSITLKVPYCSQWESKSLVKDILTGKIDARDDPKLKESGTNDKKEYLHWSWNACGMACVKMILMSLGRKSPPIIELGKICMKYGGYKINKGAYEKNDYKHSIEGLYYQPTVQFLKERFNIIAKVAKVLSLPEILLEVSKRNYVIASANPKIRIPSDNAGHRGGHLVLVVGYDLLSKTLLIHNPSGLPNKSQEYVRISLRDFEKFFAHKGIIVHS